MAESIKVTAPGSIMLMGEHAVVKGYWAIACAVDKSIEVELVARSDRDVRIFSAVGNYRGCLDDLAEDNNLRFVLKAIELQLSSLEYGFDLNIRAQFSHTLGLGSSAAVTVATVKALAQYTQRYLSDSEHLALALQVVHGVQGRGSGTDLAASIFGGVIAYQVKPCVVERLAGLPLLCLYYAGYKTKTADVLAFVASKERHHPELYANLYSLMNQLTLAAIEAVKVQDWQRRGELMNMYQGQMDSLGVNDLALSDIVYQLRTNEAIYLGVKGAKISGSGLGDCVLSLGAQIDLKKYQKISLKVSSKGVLCHSSL